MRSGASFCGLLLALWASLSSSVARAGACSGGYVDPFIDVGPRRVLAVGQAATLALGVEDVARGSWPSCRAIRTPISVTVELAVAPQPAGPYTVVASGALRSASFTPSQPGLHWLRLKARDAAGRSYETLRSVLFADGEVSVAAEGKQLLATYHGLPEKSEPLALPLTATAGQVQLPRAPAWWRLSAARDGEVAWVRVEADGTAKKTAAPSRLRIYVPDVLPETPAITVQAAGVPAQTLRCDGICELRDLPSGSLELSLRTSQNARPLAMPMQLRSAHDSASLCTMAVLGAGGPLAEPCGAVFSQPRLSLSARPAATCDGERPQDGPPSPLWLGRLLCQRAGDKWQSALALPDNLARGAITASTRHGDDVIWIEEAPRAGTPLRLLFALGKSGLVVSPAPIEQNRDQRCIASILDVTAGGEPIIAGSCKQYGKESTTGFVARRGPVIWRTDAFPAAVRALRPRGAGYVAVDEAGTLHSCEANCRALARAKEPLVGVLDSGSKLDVIGASGAVYTAFGRQLQKRLPKSDLEMSISQLIDTPSGALALFGPEIRGSEYHPFCVASVVALLRPAGWQILHSVLGEKGRRLHCGHDDSKPVVMEIAVAGQTIYARRKALASSPISGFAPIASLPGP